MRKKFYITTAVLTLCALFAEIPGTINNDFSKAASLYDTDWDSFTEDTVPTSITLETSQVYLNVGETAKVKIITEPENATLGGYGWTVSPIDVADVDLIEEGDGSYLYLTGSAVGTTEITLNFDSVSLTLNATVTGTPVTAHTKQEIRSFIKKNKVSTNAKVKYKKKPRTKSPYRAGNLSNATKKSAIKMLNNIRYIAGLNANVTLKDSYGKLAQAASLVNAANGQLSHYPARPKKMKKSLYNQGLEGASSSNIAMGFSSLNAALVYGWMSDSDSGNIDRVGHRRWILNPSMQQTGFGATGLYMAMYAFDTNGSGTQSNVCWPAQNMPLEYFNNTDAWSVSTGQKLTKNKIKVTLTRKSDNKTWTFSKKKKSGYFNVENSSYGLPGCIIFRPKKIKYKKGNTFTVKITGVPTGEINYTVNFFKL